MLPPTHLLQLSGAPASAVKCLSLGSWHIMARHLHEGRYSHKRSASTLSVIEGLVPDSSAPKVGAAYLTYHQSSMLRRTLSASLQLVMLSAMLIVRVLPDCGEVPEDAHLTLSRDIDIQHHAPAKCR